MPSVVCWIWLTGYATHIANTCNKPEAAVCLSVSLSKIPTWGYIPSMLGKGRLTPGLNQSGTWSRKKILLLHPHKKIGSCLPLPPSPCSVSSREWAAVAAAAFLCVLLLPWCSSCSLSNSINMFRDPIEGVAWLMALRPQGARLLFATSSWLEASLSVGLIALVHAFPTGCFSTKMGPPTDQPFALQVQFEEIK